MRQPNFKSVVLLPLVLVLASCGGGSDDDEPHATAAHCFNDLIYQPKNVVEQAFSEDGQTGFTLRYETLNDQPDFNGQTGLSGFQQNYSSLRGGLTAGYSKTDYFKSTGSNGRAEFGYVYKRASLAAINTVTATYSAPFVDKRALLKPGESVSYTILGEQVSNNSSETRPIHDSFVVTYLSDEQVAIGQRTVRACKFSVLKNNATSLEWIYQGIPVQTSSIATTSLTLNGKDF